MTQDDVTAGYRAKATELARMLGSQISADDPDREVIEAWAETVPGRILDVGAGTGRWSGHLARLGHTIEGIDPVAEFVDLARRTHPDVTFRHSSLADLAGSHQRWEGLLAWYSLIHLGPDELPAALSILHSVLVEGGSLLVSFFSGQHLVAVSHPAATAYLWPTEQMLGALDEAGFEVTGHHADPKAPHAYVTAVTRARG